MRRPVLAALVILLATSLTAQGQSDPVDHMTWWREARFGLFIHWGPVSLKGTEIGWSRGGERRGTGGTGDIPLEVYDNLYREFNPVEFDAREWVQIALNAGMKYLVFTSKHHDGFCMFDSALTEYKITNSPFQRDVVRELADACHEAGLKVGCELGYRGAIAGGRGWDFPVMTVDIGGGSTEFVLGHGERIESRISVPMGCVRMSERHVRHDPLTPEEVAAVQQDVRTLLDRVANTVDLGSVATLVGLAGTVTTLTAEALHLESYQPHYIDGARLSVAQILEAVDFMVRSPREVRSARGYMHPGRVDVIGAGAIVWGEIVQRVAAEVTARGGEMTHAITSERDILDGIALTA